MQPRKASRRGRAVWILLAGAVGYLIGSWNADAVRRTQTSEPPNAAQAIARRFPQSMQEAPVVQAETLGRRVAAANSTAGDAQIALFEAEPAVPQEPVVRVPVQAQPQPQPQPQPKPLAKRARAPSVQLTPAMKEATSPPPKKAIAAPPRPSMPRQANRPQYLLDAVQIASIKRRLHLTPEQERMWPAVEIALRNIGAERAQELHSRGSTRAIDPNSPEVEDLKSAAIPLLLSFSDEQKDEVRSLAHGMGLDQLASEF